jgi:predicted glycosyltransferase
VAPDVHQVRPLDPGHFPECIAEVESSQRFKIWIDLENTPHIPFFLPIIRNLREQGHEVRVTARDAYQTCEMAEFHTMPYLRIGHHYGGHLVSKVWGLLIRGLQLVSYARRECPDLALNLGSRSQNLAAKILAIPVVEIMDYEHTAESPLLRSRWYLKPDVVNPAEANRADSDRIRIYHGLKEDVYVPDFEPDDSILDELGLRDAVTIVTIRPPATQAHYHNPESEVLLERLMDRLVRTPGVRAVLLPRDRQQKSELYSRHPGWFANRRVVIPEHVVHGLNLIWHSDLIVGGGGTMNREAAALGVPVYSIYRGKIGAVDRNLANHGRLALIETPEDVDRKIRIVPRSRGGLPGSRSSLAFVEILSHLHSIIDSLRRAQPESAGSKTTPS